jgi:hypothetical protein
MFCFYTSCTNKHIIIIIISMRFEAIMASHSSVILQGPEIIRGLQQISLVYSLAASISGYGRVITARWAEGMKRR